MGREGIISPGKKQKKEKDSTENRKKKSAKASVRARDPELKILVQRSDGDAAVLGNEAHELLRGVLDLVVGLQLRDACGLLVFLLLVFPG